MSSINYIRNLRPYLLMKVPDPEDKFVRSYFETEQPSLLSPLDEFTSGMYDTTRHYDALHKFDHPLDQLEAISAAYRDDPTMQQAIIIVDNIMRPSFTVNAISASRLDKVPWKPSSSAGYGYDGLKRDNYLYARSNATSNIANFTKIGHSLLLTPAKAFARTQLSPRTDLKLRQVWGFPFHITLIEGTVAAPILQKVIASDTPFSIGRDIFTDIPADVDKLCEEEQSFYCGLDFKAFDANISNELILHFFKLIEECVTFPNSFTRNGYLLAKYYFLNTPLLMPDGKLFVVNTGVPSGSYFTSLVDSYCNLVLITYLQLKVFNRTLPTVILGDDSLFASPIRLDMDAVNRLFQTFGMTLSVNKSFCTPNRSEVTYLGHNFYGSSVTRHVFELALIALHPEDPVETIEDSLNRLEDLYRDTGKNSFLIPNIINFLCPDYLALPKHFGLPPLYFKSVRKRVE